VEYLPTQGRIRQKARRNPRDQAGKVKNERECRIACHEEAFIELALGKLGQRPDLSKFSVVQYCGYLNLLKQELRGEISVQQIQELSNETLLVQFLDDEDNLLHRSVSLILRKASRDVLTKT
jgi:hypothetical protein